MANSIRFSATVANTKMTQLGSFVIVSYLSSDFRKDESEDLKVHYVWES